MKITLNQLVIISLFVMIAFILIFFNGVVVLFVIMTFSDFFLDGIVFAPECKAGENPQITGCYDKDNIDGGQIINCLHGGVCPIGVSYEPTQQETCDSTDNAGYEEFALSEACRAETIAELEANGPLDSTDTDEDGIFDVIDKCPYDAETINGYLDLDGCPETSSSDSDGDGLTDAVDQCPNNKEDFNGESDGDGCPDIDTDDDGILDYQDECVLEKEIVNGWFDGDGCPDDEVAETTQLPEVDIIDVIINPPEISASFIDETSVLGFEANTLNLNDTVDSAIILTVIILIIMVLALVMVLKKNLGKKKRR
ncbi:MAG: hypothetical protein HOD60_08900 [Candidatus Nitrosopelagicus sp.]|jgi:hypothetical protein|nr:hypothetical protein [Candidatus Nitrosopelagicus sp.]